MLSLLLALHLHLSFGLGRNFFGSKGSETFLEILLLALLISLTNLSGMTHYKLIDHILIPGSKSIFLRRAFFYSIFAVRSFHLQSLFCLFVLLVFKNLFVNNVATLDFTLKVIPLVHLFINFKLAEMKMQDPLNLEISD